MTYKGLTLSRMLTLVKALFVFIAFITIINMIDIEYYPVMHGSAYRSTISISLTGHVAWELMIVMVPSAVIVVLPYVKRLYEEPAARWRLAVAHSPLLVASLFFIANQPSVAAALIILCAALTLIILHVPGKCGRTSRYTINWPLLDDLLGILIVVEILALARWVSYVFLPSKIYSEWSWHFASIESQLFYVPADLCPLLLVLCLFMWIMRPAVRYYLESVGIFLKLLSRQPSTAFRRRWKTWLKDFVQIEEGENGIPFMDRPRLVLLFSVVVAIALTIYPYHPNINPEGAFVGVDIHYWYRPWLDEMLKREPEGAFAYALWDVQNGSRPLYLMLLYIGSTVTGLPSDITLKLQPTILAPFLVLAVYLFLREGLGNEQLAALAALFTSLSYNVTVGMYTASFTQWFALIESYVFLTLLLKCLKKTSGRVLAATALASITVLFTHPWTWAFLMVIMATYTVATLIREKSTVNVRAKITPIVFILLVNFMMDVIKSQILNSLAGTEAISNIATKMTVTGFMNLWPNLIVAFRYFAGGYYTNPIIVGLAVAGTIPLISRKTDYDRILTSWMMVASIFMLVSTSFLQSRIIFILPLQILAASALGYIIVLTKKVRGPEKFTAQFLTLLIVLSNLAYAFRCIGNLL